MSHNLTGGVLVPAERQSMRRLMDRWVTNVTSVETPEWQAMLAQRVRIAQLKLLRNRLLAPIGISQWIGSRRSVQVVERDYNRIWKGESWPQPPDMPGSGRTNLATWDNEGITYVNGGVAQPHLDRLMHVIEVLKPRKVLEVGSGAGQNLFALAAEFPSIEFTGIELSDAGHETSLAVQALPEYSTKLVAYSPRLPKESFAYHRVKFVKGNATVMPFEDSSFDLVFTRLAIEQMNEVKVPVLLEISRVAKSNILMIEPFLDFSETPLQKIMAVRKDHFREPISFLPKVSITPLHAFSDWPQKIKEGIGAVLAEKA